MKNLFTKAATTALTGLAIFGFASAAFARTSVHEHHVALAEAVADAGVRLYINPINATRSRLWGGTQVTVL